MACWTYGKNGCKVRDRIIRYRLYVGKKTAQAVCKDINRLQTDRLWYKTWSYERTSSFAFTKNSNSFLLFNSSKEWGIAEKARRNQGAFCAYTECHEMVVMVWISGPKKIGPHEFYQKPQIISGSVITVWASLHIVHTFEVSIIAKEWLGRLLLLLHIDPGI